MSENGYRKILGILSAPWPVWGTARRAHPAEELRQSFFRGLALYVY